MSDPVEIRSRDYWFKIVDMLQQNWALIEESGDGTSRVYFASDASEVFDEMSFPSAQEAELALRRNGFGPYADDEESQQFIAPPKPPYTRGRHPNGPIYSSGRFWINP